MQKAQIIGNLGQDPDMRYSQNGVPLLRFSVASNRRRKDAQGQQYDETTWFRVTVSGNRAEALNNILHKGMKVFVMGNLSASPWVSERDDTLNAGMEIFADEVQFMSTREQDQQAGNRQSSNGNSDGISYAQRQQQNSNRNNGGQRTAAPPQRQAPRQEQQGGFEDGDLEDLPF